MESDASNRGTPGRESESNATDNSKYKFNAKQKALFQELSNKMRFVSISMLAIEVPWTIIQARLDLSRLNKWFDAAVSLTQIIVFLLISYWTYKTASSFKRIVNTKGNNPPDLWEPLNNMKNIYKLQRTILEFILVFIFLKSLVIGGIFVWNRLQIGQ